MGTILKKLRSKRELKLPSSGGLVVLYEELLTGDALNQMGLGTEKEKATNLILALIDSWDFTDESDVALPVNAENLAKLPLADFLALSEVVAKATESQSLSLEVKKNTLKTSG
jgi:hypothetical protein